jgi:hypothetical protein
MDWSRRGSVGGERANADVAQLLRFCVLLSIEAAARAVGYVPLSEGVLGNLRSFAIPVLTLALVEWPVFMRILRSDAIVTLQQDYVLLAKASPAGYVSGAEWYTPMRAPGAMPLSKFDAARQTGPRAAITACRRSSASGIDERSAFAHAPPEDGDMDLDSQYRQYTQEKKPEH